VNLHGCRDLGGEWAPFPHDVLPYQDSGDSGSDYLFPEASEESVGLQGKSELPYEELWLEEGKPSRQPLTRSLSEKSKCDPLRGSVRSKCVTSPLPVPGTLGATMKSSEIALPPPPVPPKSEAVSHFLFLSGVLVFLSLYSIIHSFIFLKKRKLPNVKLLE
jgi:hypothetical protein